MSTLIDRTGGALLRLLKLVPVLGLALLLAFGLAWQPPAGAPAPQGAQTVQLQQAAHTTDQKTDRPSNGPSGPVKVVLIKPGDSLVKLSEENGVGNYLCLKGPNRIANPALILAGHTLSIPATCVTKAPQQVKLTAYDAPAPAKAPATHAVREKTAKPSRSTTTRTEHAAKPTNAKPKNPAPKQATPARDTGVPDSVWDKLAMCESSGNWSIANGNGFYGGLQFTKSTWAAFGGKGAPQDASRSEQIAVAERVLKGQGWGAWPACSRKLGLR